MRTGRAHLVLFVLLTVVSAPSAAARQSVVAIGVRSHDDAPENARRAIEDTLFAQTPSAATQRGFDLVPLSKVAGVEAAAAKCERHDCRREIAKRLGATHVLSGRIEALSKESAVKSTTSPAAATQVPDDTRAGGFLKVRPVDLKSDQAIDISVPRPERLLQGAPQPERTVGRGYRVTLWLEETSKGELIEATMLEGEVPFLVGQVRSAVDRLLEGVSPKDVVARDRLRKTAESYERAGRVRDAVRTYRRAIAISPFHPDAARLGIDVVRAYDRSGAAADGSAAFIEWNATYGPRSAWAMAGIGGSEVQAAIQESAATLLLERAMIPHRAANDIKRIADDGKPLTEEQIATRNQLLTSAEDSYRLLVSAFEGTETSAKGAHLYGELMFDEARFDDAAKMFFRAGGVSGEHQKAAANGAVYALEREIELASKDGRIEPFDPDRVRLASREKTLPSLFVRYVAAIDQAIVVDPTFEFASAFALRAAKVHMAYGHRTEAKRRFVDVGTKFAGTKAAKIAADLQKGL